MNGDGGTDMKQTVTEDSLRVVLIFDNSGKPTGIQFAGPTEEADKAVIEYLREALRRGTFRRLFGGSR